MKKFIFTLIAAILLVFATSANAQCPMCKTALKSNQTNKKGATVGNGINKGILFLLATPYLLVGAAGFAWYNYRKNRRDA
ncbi:MAG: hypothetical protein FJ347_07705 [Sphingomonadales bacterium]|nr:hypothetical protein [Sphingomonadales bacterium]